MTSTPAKSVTFSAAVGPNSTETETKNVRSDATIEHLDVRIYRGAELDLEVRPYVLRGQDDASRRLSIVEYQGKDYVDGDGDHWEFPVSEPVERGDKIGVEVTNNSGTYSYDYRANIVLDEAGGVSRFGGLASRIQDAVGGVF